MIGQCGLGCCAIVSLGIGPLLGGTLAAESVTYLLVMSGSGRHKNGQKKARTVSSLPAPQAAPYSAFTVSGAVSTPP
jgi:hypothetical protein